MRYCGHTVVFQRYSLYIIVCGNVYLGELICSCVWTHVSGDMQVCMYLAQLICSCAWTHVSDLQEFMYWGQRICSWMSVHV